MPGFYRRQLPTIDPATVAWWRAPSLIAHAYTSNNAGARSLCGKAALMVLPLPQIEGIPQLCSICERRLAASNPALQEGGGV
jgi:hypothetical protein